MWHTNEYYPATSIASWFTRIGKFNFVGLRATLDTETLSDSAAALDSVELHALVRELAREIGVGSDSYRFAFLEPIGLRHFHNPF